MTKILAFGILFLFAMNTKAQTRLSLDLDSVDIKQQNNSSKSKGIDRAPEFPGGMEGFANFLEVNIHYPDSAKKKNLLGEVIVQIIIEKDGEVTHAKILKPVSPGIDAEALRVINLSPKWKPGIQNGNPVRVTYTVPINFTLGDESPIWNRVDIAPEFPGGMEGFSRYVKKNLRYPSNVTEVEGNVTLTFVVEKDGSLTDIRVTQGLTPQMNAEAVRLIETCPKWKPGIQDEKPVRVRYDLTIPFNLDH